MDIEFLASATKYKEDVAQMVYEEFVLKIGGTKSLNDVVNYFSNTNVDQFPITLIALDDEKCVGTVSIFENDLKQRQNYKPWLASLYTLPAHRSKGVGSQLITEVLKVVKGLGYEEIYLKTENASDYYRNRGWVYVETLIDANDESIDVFKHNLN
ncbi:GNAT family N-acetyltransferase [Viridibacillus sp. YIM B01967]|uniref:GNAT family N-acetyltransferase n=1 Tax=Viridibacillus soli TaxID=2798301 RepID=A0ABS1H7L9_9BACL|nr:GNAT family N-acetyltransferase [Viridibacillus soli]MBK3495018.1 GNAT family N-acetyltransferase [Viridibacillus soli]